MEDPCNPTHDEIREWACDPDAHWAQDWELVVTCVENVELLFSLAGDDECPKQEFFLHCLYYLVGSVVGGDGLIPSDDLERLLDRANASGNASLKRWAERSRTFIADPEAFDPACWLDGGWALDDDVWREA